MHWEGRTGRLNLQCGGVPQAEARPFAVMFADLADSNSAFNSTLIRKTCAKSCSPIGGRGRRGRAFLKKACRRIDGRRGPGLLVASGS